MDRKIYTFVAPCALMDIEALQTWLEDMSKDGYLLKSCSRTRHRFQFYKIEPLPTRYRLTPVSNQLEEWNLKPGEEYVSITEAYGWEHVCSNQWFHFFRAYNDQAREIHTDPIILHRAIRQLRNRVIKTALVWLSLPLLCLLVLFVFGGPNSFWQNLILDPTGIQILLTCFVLLAMAQLTIDLVGLCRLYHRVKQGSVPVNRKDWKKKAPVYRATFRAYPVALCILALLMTMGRAAYRDQSAYQDLPPVGTNVPFLSVADMAQSAPVQSAQRLDANYMRNWWHILSPVNYDWAEIVEIVDENGESGLVSIHVYYHEAKFLWLAENLVQEYLAQAKQAGTEMTENPVTGADFAYFYYTGHGAPAAVLRYGTTVVSVSFPRSDIDVSTLKFEYWIDKLDDALTSK